MQILDLTIKGFGKLHGRTFSLTDGVNVIYGKNEAGKSTLHTFIRCMLFGITRAPGVGAEHDVYARFRPWESPEVFEGSMRIRDGDTIWRISRTFSEGRKHLSLWNEAKKREEADPEAVLSRLLSGISETAYSNTISIGQLQCAADSTMALELKKFIANLSTSGTPDYNARKALAQLEKEREELEAAYDATASVRYTTLLSEMSSLSREISGDTYKNEMTGCRDKLQKAEEMLRAGAGTREELDRNASRDRRDLMLLGFSDEASIDACSAKADSLWNSYQEEQQAASRTRYIILPVLFLALAAVFSMVAAKGIIPTIPAWFGAGAFILLAVFTRHRRSRILENCRLYEASLAELFRRVLGGKAGDSAAESAAAESDGPESGVADSTAAESAAAGSIPAGSAAGAGSTAESSAAESSAGGSSAADKEAGEDYPEVSAITLSDFRTRMGQLKKTRRDLDASEARIAEMDREIESLKEAKSACEEAVRRQEKSQQELEIRLERLASLKEKAASLRETLKSNAKIREETDAISLASDTIRELSETIQASIGRHLNESASGLISGITGGIYTSMAIDDDLNIFMNTPGKMVPIEQVSGGTADQIYLALRLASAKLIQGGKSNLPLIFDDCFALYDEERLEAALKWLPEAYKGQILIFTCQKREMEILEQAGIPTNVVEM